MPKAILPVVPISEFEDAEPASKVGRTTNLTTGRFSFIKSHCRLPDSPHETKEHVFCSVHAVFSDHGDSGAWVFNENGNLGGMLVGGHEQQTWTYVTPMTKIFEDIERQLGCKVMLPDPYGTEWD